LWACASVRGTSHARVGIKKQDAYAVAHSESHPLTLGLVAADGAGSTTHGGSGAAIACRTLATHMREHFRVAGDDLPSEDTVWSWVDEVRDRIGHSAKRRDLQPRDFATTLVCAVVGKDGLVTAHIGDGAVVCQMDDGRWTAQSWPEHGEYASTTYFVTDDEQPRLRYHHEAQLPSAIAVFTDGIERLALDFALNDAHAAFFEGMFKPLWANKGIGRDGGLSTSLAAYLDSAGIAERTDDDKTLLLAVLR
jgi:hypothetical protein